MLQPIYLKIQTTFLSNFVGLAFLIYFVSSPKILNTQFMDLITTKMVTIRLDLAMVALLSYKCYYMDVKGAYLDGYLGGGVYVSKFSYRDSKMHINNI